MKPFALLSLAVLIGCGGPQAAPNPMSVPNVLQSITEARALEGTFFITGGIYDGAATGQTARFVVTRDDGLICTFQSDPHDGAEQTETIVTAHRLDVSGLHSALTEALLPNVAPVEVEYLTNFTIEYRSANTVSMTQTGFGDPRFDAMTAVFTQFPTPCWAFG